MSRDTPDIEDDTAGLLVPPSGLHASPMLMSAGGASPVAAADPNEAAADDDIALDVELESIGNYTDAEGGSEFGIEDAETNIFAATPLAAIIRDPEAVERERNLSLWDKAPWRQRIYSVLEPATFPSDIPLSYERASFVLSMAMMGVIVISCLAIMGASYPEYVLPGVPVQWILIEIISVVIFSVDTVSRFIVAPNRLLFVLDPLTWLDVISVLPFYGTLFGLSAALWLRIVRVFRLARLIQVLQSSRVMGLQSVLAATKHSVSGIFVFIAVAGTCLLILSTCMYFAERGSFDSASQVWNRKCLPYDTCLTEPSPFQSISDAFWYTLVTMATVGFSDQYATSGIGQFVSACMMLLGVLLIALPTMILAGHYDAGGAGQRSHNISWRYIHDQNVARLTRPPVPLKDTLSLHKHWYASADPKLRRSLETLPIPLEERPLAVLSFNEFDPKLLLRRTGDTKRFVYDPLLTLVRDAEGRPRARVVLGHSGMPTTVVFDLLVTRADVQEAAMEVAGRLILGGVAHVDTAGLHVQHHSPLASVPPSEADVRPRYEMLPMPARGGFRKGNEREVETTVPLVFRRIPHHSDRNRDLTDERRYLCAESVAQECLASVLGSSLTITRLLPLPPVRKRIIVVVQMIADSRFHRELTLYGSKGVLEEAASKERVAFITHSDAYCLLRGAHQKVDLYDESLVLTEPGVVDMDITSTVLGRLRKLQIVQIPQQFRSCVFNHAVLSVDDWVYEVPLSIFAADENDLVEEDALGYIEVTAAAIAGTKSRVDFSVSTRHRPTW